MDFELLELFTVSQLTEGPSTLEEGPSLLKPDYLHLSRVLYNSTESPSNWAEGPWNYISEIESLKL